jgi:hypothetical protein
MKPYPFITKTIFIMKIIHIITVFATFITSVTATFDDLHKAIDKGYMRDIDRLCKKDDFRNEGLAYAIKNKSTTFISYFVKRTKSVGQPALRMLCRERSGDDIESVLKQTSFPDDVLEVVASELIETRSFEKAVILLNKIKDQGYLKCAIERDIKKCR